MPISFVDAKAAETQSAAASNITATGTLPTGLAANDTMLMSVSSNRGTTESLVSDATAAGWTLDRTQADGAETVRYYHKVAGGSESAPVAVFTNAGAVIHSIITHISAYRDVDTAAPILLESSAPEAGASITTHSGPTLNNTDAGAWGVSMMTARQIASPQAWTPGTGLTERLDTDALIASANDHWALTQDTNGVLATGNWTPQGTTAATSVACMWSVLLKPSAGGGGGGPTIEFTEDFEGGPNGALPEPFATVDFDSATVYLDSMTHSNLRSIDGSLSLRNLNPTATALLYRLFSPARSVIYQRIYFYMADFTQGSTVMGVMTGTSVQQSNVQLSAAGGTFRLRDGATITATSSTTPTVGQWYRLELKTDLSALTHALRIFTGANLHGTTADEELSGSIAAGVGGSLLLEDASGDIILEDASGSLVTEDYVAGTGTTFERAFVGTNAANTFDWFVDAYADAPDTWVGPADVTPPPTFVDTSKFFLVL